jgi:hypothetical protein
MLSCMQPALKVNCIALAAEEKSLHRRRAYILPNFWTRSAVRQL